MCDHVQEGTCIYMHAHVVRTQVITHVCMHMSHVWCAGKSTLLRVVAGVDDYSQGVLTRNKGALVGYLPQDPQLPQESTVLQVGGELGASCCRWVRG